MLRSQDPPDETERSQSIAPAERVETARSKRRTRSAQAAPAITVGVLLARPAGRYRVEFSWQGKRRRELAHKLRASTVLRIGQELVLAFADDDARKPIILGTLEDHRQALSDHAPPADSRSLTLEAEQEIVLRCGKSSITLTRAGKVIIRGEYVVSRSSGVNSIKGAVIQLN